MSLLLQCYKSHAYGCTDPGVYVPVVTMCLCVRGENLMFICFIKYFRKLLLCMLNIQSTLVCSMHLKRRRERLYESDINIKLFLL